MKEKKNEIIRGACAKGLAKFERTVAKFKSSSSAAVAAAAAAASPAVEED